jgi:isoleucyl-tRNA synthetase
LSAFYLDVLKDRLYCEAAGSLARRSAQTALHAIARALACVLAPILSHTSEEVWQLLDVPDKAASVQLADWPEPTATDGAAVLARWEPVLALRTKVNLALEDARQSKVIGNPLEARVRIGTDVTASVALAPFVADLHSVLRVSSVELSGAEGVADATVAIKRAEGQKCARCWLIRSDVGADRGFGDICARCARVVGRE